MVDSWSYVASDVPVPGGETVRMNLWQYQGLRLQMGQPVELVFSNFDFLHTHINCGRVDVT